MHVFCIYINEGVDSVYWNNISEMLTVQSLQLIARKAYI